MDTHPVRLTGAELSTLLLALRCLQQIAPPHRMPLACQLLDDPGPILVDEEIDELCVVLDQSNTGAR